MRDSKELLDHIARSYSPSAGDIEDALVDSRRRSRGILNDSAQASEDVSPSRIAGRRRRAVATSGLLAACLALGGIAVAQSEPSEEEVAARYSLQPHSWSPLPGDGSEVHFTTNGLEVNGQVVDDPDCDRTQQPGKVGVLKFIDDHFYCIRADSYIEAWIIGQELAGDPPTEEEIADMTERLSPGSDG